MRKAPRQSPEGAEKVSGAEALKALVQKFKENGGKITKLLSRIDRVFKGDTLVDAGKFMTLAKAAGVNFDNFNTLNILVKLGKNHGFAHFANIILEYMITGKNEGAFGGRVDASNKPASLNTLVLLAQEQGLPQHIYELFAKGPHAAPWQVASEHIKPYYLRILFNYCTRDKRAQFRILWTAKELSETNPLNKDYHLTYKNIKDSYLRRYPGENINRPLK